MNLSQSNIYPLTRLLSESQADTEPVGRNQRNSLNRSHSQVTNQVTHVAIDFEVPGGWQKERDAVVLTVLQMLMRGGGLFSAAAPRKGMHSRLFLRVLNEHQQIQSFSAFNNIFNNTGLFGIYASISPDFVSKPVDLGV
ncbi:mitochondrial processing peptidase [Trifolium repens]|nr:mitochondrial processing peptidase [Trifolium repens]